jgi:thiamine pyrophosphate-dependent acetolactate synthase large subunit-like protein
MWTVRHGTLIAEDALVVQVDTDEAALGRNLSIALGVRGDAAAIADDVLSLLRRWGDPVRERYRTESTRQTIAQRGDWRKVPFNPLGGTERIDPRTLTIELDRILPTERTVSVDSGNFMGYPSQFFTVPDEFGFCFTQAFQSVGLGLATAIGAAKARPDRLSIAALGDGGFFMGISELETVVREGLDMVVVVYDDHQYGAEVHHFPPTADMSTVVFPEVDIAAIARGYGFIRSDIESDEAQAALDHIYSFVGGQ